VHSIDGNDMHEIHNHDDPHLIDEIHNHQVGNNDEPMHEGQILDHEIIDYNISYQGNRMRQSVKIDVDLCTSKNTNGDQNSKININVRGAYLHALGDLIQSIGVMISGCVIWYKPNLKILDPICTILFSILVLATTIQILRDVIEVLMESTPREIDATTLQNGLLGVSGVVAVHELHIWAITMGKTLLACHILAEPLANTNEVLHKVTDYCEKTYGISHVTIQVERDI
jgi:zinc transporter 2